MENCAHRSAVMFIDTGRADCDCPPRWSWRYILTDRNKIRHWAKSCYKSFMGRQGADPYASHSDTSAFRRGINHGNTLNLNIIPKNIFPNYAEKYGCRFRKCPQLYGGAAHGSPARDTAAGNKKPWLSHQIVRKAMVELIRNSAEATQRSQVGQIQTARHKPSGSRPGRERQAEFRSNELLLFARELMIQRQ